MARMTTHHRTDDSQRAAATPSFELAPFLLEPQLVERVWGVSSLAPWYRHPGGPPIGEAWLTGELCQVVSGAFAGSTLAAVAAEAGAALLGSFENFPLLIKILFPHERLSIQVHPGDALAATMRAEGKSAAYAKNECWYALEAESGATVALGFQADVTPAQAEASLGTSAMEALMAQVPVSRGEMIYVEAGTVHAIGPGLVLLEVQQMSDSTFRLWDYGRPREMHVTEGKRALRFDTASGPVLPQPIAGGERLIEVAHFSVERYEAGGEPLRFKSQPVPECLVCLDGEVEIRSAGGVVHVPSGSAAVIPACVKEYSIRGSGIGSRGIAARCLPRVP
jgi:mannose-6-phosphate isomerase